VECDNSLIFQGGDIKKCHSNLWWWHLWMEQWTKWKLFFRIKVHQWLKYWYNYSSWHYRNWRCQWNGMQ